jgi:acetoacetyl-CoA synthetase
MNIYREHINHKFTQNLQSSHDLHRWSVTHPHDFWIDLHSYTDIVPPLPRHMTTAYDPNLPMSAVPKFFEGATVNYAENVFHGKELHTTALIGIREGQGLDGDVWTWGKLHETVRKLRSALLHSGIRSGDRVGAVISTSVWSVALLLAAASMGAVWTSIAPDIGEEVGSVFYILIKTRIERRMLTV